MQNAFPRLGLLDEEAAEPERVGVGQVTQDGTQ